ncbi:MAG: tRNA lysidine(34) synthetase TilS [Pseudomonadota bacterium]
MSTDAKPICPVERDRLFRDLGERHLVLCVSGGPDSMALMHLIAHWAKTRWPEGSVRERIFVATVDHGLRPEAASEAAFVCREAARLGLSHQTLVWRGVKPVSGIQEAAREARRRLLAEFAYRHTDASAPATLVMAHHADDQAETFLMRLARGSGLDGLSGMRKTDQVAVGVPSALLDAEALEADALRARGPVPLIRPFLGVSRDRLHATLASLGGQAIADPSNEDDSFERVRVRKTLAALGDVGLSAEKIALSCRRLGDVRTFFDAERLMALAVDDCEPQARLSLNEGVFATCGFRRFAHARNRHVGLSILREILSAFGGASRAAELSEVDDLFDWIFETDATARTLGGCKIEVLGGPHRLVRVYREVRGHGLPAVRLVPGANGAAGTGPDVSWDGGRCCITTNAHTEAGVSVDALGSEGWVRLKRDVPGLERLKLPAAAMAALPVVRLNGDLRACPLLHRYLMKLPIEHRPIVQAWQRQPYSGFANVELRHRKPFLPGLLPGCGDL